eukprot:3122049-Lingulodinium_polyedra.AAC.1
MAARDRRGTCTPGTVWGVKWAAEWPQLLSEAPVCEQRPPEVERRSKQACFLIHGLHAGVGFLCGQHLQRVEEVAQ